MKKYFSILYFYNFSNIFYTIKLKPDSDSEFKKIDADEILFIIL